MQTNLRVGLRWLYTNFYLIINLENLDWFNWRYINKFKINIKNNMTIDNIFGYSRI